LRYRVLAHCVDDQHIDLVGLQKVQRIDEPLGKLEAMAAPGEESASLPVQGLVDQWRHAMGMCQGK